MRAAEYPYPPDEFDAAAAGGPQGVHRRPRSAWSRWWPFVVVLVVLPVLAYSAVTLATGGNPFASVGLVSAPATSAPAESTSSAEPSASETTSAAPTPSQAPAPAKDLSRAVVVQNATSTTGLASDARTVLTSAGFTTVETGNFAGTVPSASVVYYPAAADATTAAAVAAALKITTVTESAEASPDGVLVVLAADYEP